MHLLTGSARTYTYGVYRIYGIVGREITKYTVIYGVYIRTGLWTQRAVE